MSEVTMNGRSFLRALSYALRICPPAESASRLAHVVFVGNKIVCSDGQRWHAGIVDGEFDIPRVIARESAAELVIRLAFAETISRRHSSSFFVHIDGNRVDIHFGEEKNAFKLSDVNVGHVPTQWLEPVPVDAPLLAEIPEVHCQHLKDSASWWMSWQKDHGSVKMRGVGGNNPIRYDISCGDEAVAVAFLLPVQHRAAQLQPDEPLFAGASGGKIYGQSILDLSFDGPPPPEPRSIKIGETELNVTGLGEPANLLKLGPCVHRSEPEPCLPCTEDAIKAARKLVEMEEDKILPFAKPKKRGRKAKEIEDQPESAE